MINFAFPNIRSILLGYSQCVVKLYHSLVNAYICMVSRYSLQKVYIIVSSPPHIYIQYSDLDFYTPLQVGFQYRTKREEEN